MKTLLLAALCLCLGACADTAYVPAPQPAYVAPAPIIYNAYDPYPVYSGYRDPFLPYSSVEVTVQRGGHRHYRHGQRLPNRFRH